MDPTSSQRQIKKKKKKKKSVREIWLQADQKFFHSTNLEIRKPGE